MNPEFESEGNVEKPAPKPTPSLGGTAVFGPTDRAINLFMESAMKGMPLFTLVAKDATAHIVVDMWANIQRYLAQQLHAGVALPDVLQDIEKRCFNTFAWGLQNEQTIPDKIGEAYRIADSMRKWPTRKVAD